MATPLSVRLRHPSAWSLAMALVMGALTGLGQAPWGLWWLAVPALGAIAAQVARARTPGRAFLRAWVAGLAGFALAMHWIVEPFFVDAPRHGWMAPFALLAMTGGMALFWGMAAAFAAWGVRAPVARIWVFALAMLALEDLRGLLFTGFPWALTGHVWIGTPADQLAAPGGALLLSALSLGLAAAIGTGWLRWRQGRRVRAGVVLALAALALGAGWGWGAARLARPLPPAPGIALRLVQGNVPQHLKWNPDYVEGFFQRHLALTATPAASPRALVIWPESAAPFFLDRPGGGLVAAAEAAGGATVMLGLDRRSRDAEGTRHYHNSLAVLDPAGAPVATYDKHHLVPFGEYVPLIGALAEGEGWGGLVGRALSGYTPGPGPVVLDLGLLGRVLPLICYEAVFPRDLRTPERPDWIVQITNDAWFGSLAGPYQHFAQARLRAVETGLPLVRAANTGVSAVVDARGRVVAELALNVTGVLDADLPGALPPTPYARTGDAPWHGGLALGVMLVALAGLWRRRRPALGH